MPPDRIRPLINWVKSLGLAACMVYTTRATLNSQEIVLTTREKIVTSRINEFADLIDGWISPLGKTGHLCSIMDGDGIVEECFIILACGRWIELDQIPVDENQHMLYADSINILLEGRDRVTAGELIDMLDVDAHCIHGITKRDTGDEYE